MSRNKTQRREQVEQVKQVDGEQTDGEQVKQVDGEQTDGEQVEQVDGEQTDGEQVEQVDGEQTDGEQVEQVDGEQVDGEQTDGEQVDGEQVEQVDGEQTDGDGDGEQVDNATDLLRTVWRAVADQAENDRQVALSLVAVDQVETAFARVAALTKKAERRAIVRDIGAELFDEFDQVEALFACNVTTKITNLLAAKADGPVALAVDTKRADAVRAAAFGAVATLLDASMTDDQRAAAAAIPHDDPAFVALFEKLIAAATKTGRGSTGARAGGSTGAPRADGRDLSALIAGAVTADFQSISAVKKAIGSTGGAVDNVWRAMRGLTPKDQPRPNGAKLIDGVRAVEQDGKRGFIAS